MLISKSGRTAFSLKMMTSRWNSFQPEDGLMLTSKSDRTAFSLKMMTSNSGGAAISLKMTSRSNSFQPEDDFKVEQLPA